MYATLIFMRLPGKFPRNPGRSISLWLGIRIVGRLLSLTGLPDCAKEWGIIAE